MRKKMNNMGFVGFIFCLAALVLVIIGLRVYVAPETKKENYVRTTALITAKTMSSSPGREICVEFDVNGKTVRATPRFPVSYDFQGGKGDMVPILYCPSKVMFIQSYTVLLDDGGASQQRLIRSYHVSGLVLMFAGLVLLIPAFLFFRKR